MRDHINRILKGELQDHYCGKNILNEYTELMAEKVHSEITSCTQSAKYFSVIADCRPDISHMKKFSVTIRYVDVTNENNDNEIRERFLGFPSIGNSSAKGLTDVILKFLKKNIPELKHCRGQGYDNVANKKGKIGVVQKGILDHNPLAFLCRDDSMV
jgi:hypothetical protein